MWMSFKGGRSGIDIRGEDIHADGIDLRLFGGEGFVGGIAYLLVNLGFEGFDLFLVEDAFAD
jgi:hypothetical protein